MVLLAVPFIKHVRCLGLYVRSESYSGQYIFPPEICLHLEILMSNISQIFVLTNWDTTIINSYA